MGPLWSCTLWGWGGWWDPHEVKYYGAGGSWDPYGFVLYGVRGLVGPPWGSTLWGWGLMGSGTPMETHIKGLDGSQDTSTGLGGC